MEVIVIACVVAEVGGVDTFEPATKFSACFHPRREQGLSGFRAGSHCHKAKQKWTQAIQLVIL